MFLFSVSLLFDASREKTCWSELESLLHLQPYFCKLQYIYSLCCRKNFTLLRSVCRLPTIFFRLSIIIMSTQFIMSCSRIWFLNIPTITINITINANIVRFMVIWYCHLSWGLMKFWTGFRFDLISISLSSGMSISAYRSCICCRRAGLLLWLFRTWLVTSNSCFVCTTQHLKAF